jgi:hypothetical protein
MISLDALFQQFLSERHYLQNVSPKTLDWYRTAWKAFFLEDAVLRCEMIAWSRPTRSKAAPALPAHVRLIAANTIAFRTDFMVFAPAPDSGAGAGSVLLPVT